MLWKGTRNQIHMDQRWSQHKNKKEIAKILINGEAIVYFKNKRYTTAGKIWRGYYLGTHGVFLSET